MPAGWRVTIVEHWPDEVMFGDRKAPGQVTVVQVLSPDAPDPTQAQLDAFEATFARYGGSRSSRDRALLVRRRRADRRAAASSGGLALMVVGERAGRVSGT